VRLLALLRHRRCRGTLVRGAYPVILAVLVRAFDDAVSAAPLTVAALVHGADRGDQVVAPAVVAALARFVGRRAGEAQQYRDSRGDERKQQARGDT
jgi:hypothetical protein